MPESEEVERTVGGHVMLRMLDVARALELMDRPAGQGSYVVHVSDAFLPANGGSYRVAYGDGEGDDGPARVERTDEAPDLEVTQETLCMLVAGRIGLEGARYREGTTVYGNEALLSAVFAGRPVSLAL